MPRPAYDRASGYRRGTIMGLTVAEAFMLIAFVLLMLLGVWMATARDRIVALETRLAEAERFANAFTEKERAAALAHREQLTQLGEDLQKLDNIRELTAAGASPSDAVRALQLLPALAEGHSPEELLDRARLLDEAQLETLAEAAVALPPETRVALTDLARLEDFPELAARLAGLDAATLAADLAELEAYRATGQAPEAIDRLTVAISDVAQARIAAAEAQETLAAAVVRSTGPVVASLGGAVRGDGSIVFPDTLLFEAGSATITPAFDGALARICRPWIETLHAQREALSAVRIEGHASSEWTGAAAPRAFERNLDLSQARAAAVFKRCLALAGDDAVAEWARTRMSAVGFSSSRPVLTGGAEDRAASRRVVFAIDAAAPGLPEATIGN